MIDLIDVATRGFLAPKGALEKKPPHGQPCTRCGLCCVAIVCPLGQVVFRRRAGPCPALRRDAESLSSCGLVDEPAVFAPMVALRAGVEMARAAAKLLIGSTTGCDARFNGEPPDEKFYEKLREFDRRNASALRRARKVWGIR